VALDQSAARVMARRFPPPWSVEDIGAAFVAKDSAGQKLAYVYYEDYATLTGSTAGRAGCSPMCGYE
jgi:hypothetical protein